MGVIQVQLPDEIKAVIDRQVADGRATSEAEFVVEAVRRYAEEFEIEDAIVAEAMIGIADLEAGHYVTLASPEDLEAMGWRGVWCRRSRRSAGPATF